MGYVESEMNMSYIKEKRKARRSERKGRLEIEDGVLERDGKEFRSPGVDLGRMV